MFKRTSDNTVFTEQLAKYQLLRSIAQDAVAFVEQTSRMAEKMTLKQAASIDKKEAAIRRYISALSQFGAITVDPLIIDMFIEAAVFELGGSQMLATFEREPNDDT